MNCFFVTNHLSGLMDGQLAPDAHGEVEQHLKTCVGCRRHWEEMLALKETLQRIKIPEYNQTARTKTRYILTRQKLKTPWTRYFIFSPLTLIFLSVVTLSAGIWSHRYPKPLPSVHVGSPKVSDERVETVTVDVAPTATPTPLATATPVLTPSPMPTVAPAIIATPAPLPKPTMAVSAGTPTPTPIQSPSPESSPENVESLFLDVVIDNQSAEDLKEAFVKDCKKVKCRTLEGKKEIELNSNENHFTTTVVISVREFAALAARISKWGQVTPQVLPPEIQAQLASSVTLRIVLNPKE